MLEINEGVFRPQRRAQLLAPYHFPVRLQKQQKHLEWLFLNRHPDAGPEQFTAAQVHFIRVETRACPTQRTVGSQLKPR